MPYTQFVEFGRVALVSYGPLADKLAVIVDIVDDKRVLIDIPNTSEPRQVIPVKRLNLTDIVIKIDRAAPINAVAAAFKNEKVQDAFSKTNWAKHMQNSKNRDALNDFQRFKYNKLSAKRDELVKAELAKH